MARYEVTMLGGEKILLDHPTAATDDMRRELAENSFLVFREVKAGSSTPMKDVIVATGMISLLRPLPEGSTQGSNFQPKR